MSRQGKVGLWIASGFLALLAVADIFSHAKNLIQLPTNAGIVWRMVRSVWLGFTTQAFVFLAIAGVILLGSLCEFWLPYVKTLWAVAMGRPRPGTTTDVLRKLAKPTETQVQVSPPDAAHLTAPRFDPALVEALSQLISRAWALELPKVSVRLDHMRLGVTEAAMWKQDHAAWEDAAVSFLRRIGRTSTANIFRDIKAPKGVYAYGSYTYGIDEAALNALRGQRETLEAIHREMAA